MDETKSSKAGEVLCLQLSMTCSSLSPTGTLFSRCHHCIPVISTHTHTPHTQLTSTGMYDSNYSRSPASLLLSLPASVETPEGAEGLKCVWEDNMVSFRSLHSAS